MCIDSHPKRYAMFYIIKWRHVKMMLWLLGATNIKLKHQLMKGIKYHMLRMKSIQILSKNLNAMSCCYLFTAKNVRKCPIIAQIGTPMWAFLPQLARQKGANLCNFESLKFSALTEGGLHTSIGVRIYRSWFWLQWYFVPCFQSKNSSNKKCFIFIAQ